MMMSDITKDILEHLQVKMFKHIGTQALFDGQKWSQMELNMRISINNSSLMTPPL